MHYRELGKSGIKVSEVGLGGNRLGQPYASDEFWTRSCYTCGGIGCHSV